MSCEKENKHIISNTNTVSSSGSTQYTALIQTGYESGGVAADYQ